MISDRNSADLATRWRSGDGCESHQLGGRRIVRAIVGLAFVVCPLEPARQWRRVVANVEGFRIRSATRSTRRRRIRACGAGLARVTCPLPPARITRRYGPGGAPATAIRCACGIRLQRIRRRGKVLTTAAVDPDAVQSGTQGGSVEPPNAPRRPFKGVVSRPRRAGRFYTQVLLVTRPRGVASHRGGRTARTGTGMAQGAQAASDT